MELSVRNIASKIWYKMRKTFFNIPIDINFFPLWSINLYCNVWQQHNILWVFCARENSIFPQYPPPLSTNPFCLLITSPFSSTVYYFYVCLYTTCVFFQSPHLPHLTANIGKRFFLFQLSTSTRRVSLSFVRFEQSILTFWMMNVNLVPSYSKENDVVSSINQTQHIIRKIYWFLWSRWWHYYQRHSHKYTYVLQLPIAQRSLNSFKRLSTNSQKSQFKKISYPMHFKSKTFIHPTYP